MAREAENALILGVALRLRSGQPYGDEAPYLACVEETGRITDVFVRTPPHQLLLAADTDCEATLELVAEHLSQGGKTLPGVHGRVEHAEAFANRWIARTGSVCVARMGQRLFKLVEVSSPTAPSGIPRWAEPDDTNVLIAWVNAFLDEALPEDEKPDPRAMIERLIRSKQLLMWDDHGPASICSCGRPTPHGMSVNLVYTPPGLRGHGYASANVAEMSRRILGSGKAFCTLFTDLANPISNKIYERIGYRAVNDFVDIRFHDATGGA